MAELSHLFSPIKVGNCEIRNRILQSGHGTLFSEEINGMILPTERHARYYERRAKGGIGLIIMEAVAVSPHSTIVKGLCHGFRDEIIPRFKMISDAVHAQGAKIFCQAWHGGNKSQSFNTHINAESVSAVPSLPVGEVPEVLDEEGIQRVIQQFVDFSLRLKEGGFDGVELHFGHGYLGQQFLSPFTNIRDDQYGGSLENRMRFSMEVFDAVRKAVGKDFVVGVRTTADEMVPHGLTLDDMKEIMPIWEKTGNVDFLDITIGTYKVGAMLVAPMMVPPRPFVYLAAEIRQLVDLPVFTAIRINDPVMADDIIKNGEADMVVMTRATLCDPDMPNKAKEGRLDDIRQCVGCNEGCWERATAEESITCLQNPEAGREGVFEIRPASVTKKLMVIGGGCGGMEAAVVAKQRGHDVALYEKGSELGGATLIHAKAASREEMRQAVRFLEHEVKRVGVEVHLNTEVTAEMVLKENPDVVILATGATTIDDPRPDVVGPDAAIEIEQGAHVVTAEDVVAGKAQAGKKVVVADYQKSIKGLIAAEVLADQGKEVTVIQPLPVGIISAGSYNADGATVGVQMMNLTIKNVERVSDFEVKKALPGKVVIRNIFTEAEKEVEADTLVTSYWRKADDRLYKELKGKVKELHKIGDCLAPRRTINAIYDGYKVASEI